MVLMVLADVVPILASSFIDDRVTFRLVLVVVGLAWVAWVALAFQCPQCKYRIGWWYVNHKGVSEWFTGFLRATRCPICKFEPPA